jgi:hypothetical protein
MTIRSQIQIAPKTDTQQDWRFAATIWKPC